MNEIPERLQRIKLFADELAQKRAPTRALKQELHPKLYANAEQRLWSKVHKTDRCWIWIGHRNHNGYGTLHFDGKTQRVHRITYELAYGTIPKGLFVCHSCDTPACVRPDHLWLGTQKDNINDSISKGRSHQKRTEPPTE